MQLSWQHLNTQYLALSLRERVLIGTALLVSLCVCWYLILGNPMLSAGKQKQEQIQKLQSALASLHRQQQALHSKLQQSPRRGLQQRVAQLNKQLALANKQLKNKLHGLIAPTQMAKVLESVLQQHHQLILLKVQSQPATPLVVKTATGKPADKGKTVKPTTEVYRHGLQLEFEGSYMATLAYLKSLQALPWDFYWDAVRLQVEKYPQAKITIEVHTLSLTESWMNV